MTAGLVLGVISGLTVGLLAVGLVLIFTANRFVNLAHGQLGALSAVLMATLVLDAGLTWWLAFPICVAIGIALGLLTDRYVVRPLRRQRRRAATMLLVTIGVGQLLTALTYVPIFSPDETTLFRKQYPLPFTVHLRPFGVDLTGAHLMILVLVPMVVASLSAFLRYTTFGRSVRAAASNPDAARLCGVSVERVSALTWGIAGAMSAVTAILLAPGQSVFSAASFGPTLLFAALGAAAFGSFVSIRGAMAGGLVLGLVEHITLAVTKDGPAAQLAVFVAVIAILVMRGRRIAVTSPDNEASEDRPVTRVPPVVAGRLLVRRHRLFMGVAATVGALVLPHLPYLSSGSNRFLLVILLVYATVGIGLTMLIGWAGQISLGHFAVLGVGAYVGVRLGDTGLSLPYTVVGSGVVGAALMAVIGLPALRLRGLTLAVTTLGFAVAAPAWLLSQSWFNASGRTVVTYPDLGVAGVGKVTSELSLYHVALGLLVLAALSAGALRRSLPGRLIVAARDNDAALATFGVAPTTVKLSILSVSGFFAAAAGVVWGMAWNNLSVDLVQAPLSLALLVIPVVGGLGSISGAVAGTLLIYVPTFFIAPELTPMLGDFGSNLGFQLALAGLGLVGIPLLYPAGVAGLGQQLWRRMLSAMEQSVVRWRPLDDAPALSVRDVSVAFGGIQALDSTSIVVGDGEIVGLIGPNGAGKTTLLNVVSGQLAPSHGSIVVGGHDVTGLAPELRSAFGLNRAFQDARLFPGLTVTEAVQVSMSSTRRAGVISSMIGAPWARAMHTQSRAEATKILDSLGLTEWADSLTADLSTGVRRITDLAMQIAARPRVLLLDEPAGGVAQREAEAFGPLLRRLRDELGCGVLIVEHDMPLLMSVCDRIYAMAAGHIIAEGTPSEIRHDPAVVASYLGTDAAAIERSGSSSASERDRSNGQRSRPLKAAQA